MEYRRSNIGYSGQDMATPSTIVVNFILGRRRERAFKRPKDNLLSFNNGRLWSFQLHLIVLQALYDNFQ